MGYSDSKELLVIEPDELRFPFEAKKQISCSLQLRNIMDECIAFKVRTTKPEDYCIQPNVSVMPPRSTCDVIVTTRAPVELPPYASDFGLEAMICYDKFVVQSTVVMEGTTINDITPDTFKKEAGNLGKEVKMGVVYVQPPGPLLEGSKCHVFPNSKKLLVIEPNELRFPFEVKKHLSCSLQLRNITDECIAFKVKRTNPKDYCVRPKISVMSPWSTCNVTVTTRAPVEVPPDACDFILEAMICYDEFVVQSTKVMEGTTINDITPETFKKEAGNLGKEVRMGVVYVWPEPVLEGSKCHIFPDSNKLLIIEPNELRFPFGVKKQISVSLELKNITDECIAFKVRTTKPKDYTVQPNVSVMPPRSSCNVTVTKQEMGEVPLDMQCNDKFLVQSTPVTEGTTINDITPETFKKEAGNLVNEVKIRVVYVQPPGPSYTQAAREEGKQGLQEIGTSSLGRPRWAQLLHWRPNKE